jgi:hypothetical protein
MSWEAGGGSLSVLQTINYAEEMGISALATTEGTLDAVFAP